jgi:hypothetical protein
VTTTQDDPTALLADRDGTTTEIGFSGPDGGRVLVVTHRPVGPARAAVVIASSIQSEFLKNNRREILISRRLAALGFGVKRFQFRGAGPSDDTAIGLPSMTEDLEMVLAEARTTFGVEEVGIVGTRLSALAAGIVAAGIEGAPLALIEPVVAGKRFFKEMIRTLLMRNVAAQSGAEINSADLVAGWERDGMLDVLGFGLDWSLYQTLDAVTLPAELGSGVRPVLLVQMGRGEALRADLAKLAEAWRAQGHEVAELLIPHEEAWWFHQDADVLTTDAVDTLNQGVVDGVVDWFSQVWGLGR